MRLAAKGRPGRVPSWGPAGVRPGAWVAWGPQARTRLPRAQDPFRERATTQNFGLSESQPNLDLAPKRGSVFARQDGTRIASIKTSFAAACARAGITDCYPHDLRRTCGSWLIQGGTDVARVARILRHADIRMTAKVYAHLRTEDLENDLAGLAARLTPGDASHHRITLAAADDEAPDLLAANA